MRLKSMTDQATYAIGVDIGGTKIGVGLVNANGNLIDSNKLPTQSKKGIPNAAERIRDSVHYLLSKHGISKDQILGMGVGCPGPLDLETGKVLNPYTLPGWENDSLTHTLEKVTGMPVRLENDADAALLGECWIGAGQGKNPVVMLTFGTGVGGAVRCDDRVYRGVRGEHPEIGLISVSPDMPSDYSGVDGSLESLTSGTGIAHQGKPFGYKNAAAVFAGADRGFPDALDIVDRAFSAVGTAAWILTHTFAPERIILGGGLMDHHYELFAEVMTGYISRAKLLPENVIDIAKAQLGNRAGMIGAAGLWLKE